jgi:tetratricopeptide (TPR) repeat protein
MPNLTRVNRRHAQQSGLATLATAAKIKHGHIFHHRLLIVASVASVARPPPDSVFSALPVESKTGTVAAMPPRPAQPVPPAPVRDAAPLDARWWLTWLGLLGLCVLAYLPALHGGFLWDDNGHVTKPELRSLGGLARIWFEPGATQQYYPVLHSAFWLEHGLWGDSPAAYRWLNVLLHALAAGLLVRVLQRLAIRGAWLAGFVFALHPVCVESVAWISEQKNALSTVFYLLAMLAYLRFDSNRNRMASPPPGAAPPHPSRCYFLATFLFILAVLSKSVTATLPAALLVLAWWQRGRLAPRRDVAPLLPWFAIGLAAGLCTAWVERKFIGAEGAAYDLHFLQRVLLAGRVLWFYLGKLLWPLGLSFVYPRWSIETSDVFAYAGLLATLIALTGLWLLRRRSRAPLAGALFFAGTLFPALGFFNVYPFIYSYVADHFQYLACLGLIVPLCAGLVLAFASQPGWLRRGLPAVLIALLGFLTWTQAHDYRDNITLYRATLVRNPRAWMAAYNLGMELAARGETNAAIASYRAALRIWPEYPEAHANLAMSLLTQPEGKNEAITHLEIAVRLKPELWQAECNLANTLLSVPGRADEAIAHYKTVLRSRPELAEIQMNLGIALLSTPGHETEAVAHLESALRTNPDLWQAHFTLANVLLGLPGRRAEAIPHLESVLRLNPGFAPARQLLEQLR